jgi:leader peptidase (prepilin peptidase) / N-methyltransferase
VEILEAWPAVLFVAVALFGLVVGSFLNVVVFRLPVMLERAWRAEGAATEDEEFTPPAHATHGRFDLWWPPSACPSCGQPIKLQHNVPVLSWLMLRGRCAHCEAPVSKRYPLVEGFAAIAALVVAYVYGPSWQTLAGLGFTWSLIALALIDYDHKLLPDSITLPLLWAGMLLSLVTPDGAPLFTDVRSSVIGAAAGYSSLWAVFQLFKLVTGKEGMGYGDFKLLAAIGAWLGWQQLPLVILLSAAVGSVVGIALIVFQGRSRQATIPFGPYLAAAGWIAMLKGNALMAWYLELMR